MPKSANFPVSFKRGDELLFDTQGYYETDKGEPYETLQIYYTATYALRRAIKSGNAPNNAFRISDAVVIERPAGVKTTYTDEQINELMDTADKLDKFELQRDSLISVFSFGGIAGGLIGDPVDVCLHVVSEPDFARVAQIVELIQTQGAKLQMPRIAMDGYDCHVQVGAMGSKPKDMKPIFRGGPFGSKPAIIMELEGILAPYMAKTNRMDTELLDFECMFFIAESCPVFDAAEEKLRQSGRHDIANKMVKLQQDVGVAIDREMNPQSENPPPGTAAAALYSAFEPVTTERLRIFTEAANALSEGPVRAEFQRIINLLPIPSHYVPGQKPPSLDS